MWLLANRIPQIAGRKNRKRPACTMLDTVRIADHPCLPIPRMPLALPAGLRIPLPLPDRRCANGPMPLFALAYNQPKRLATGPTFLRFAFVIFHFLFNAI